MSKKSTVDDVFRHNFLQDCKLHTVCADEGDTRPALECVHFDKGYAFASDSHVAVRLKIDGFSNLEPEEIEKLNGKSLHARHFKQLLDCDVITEITDEGISATNIGTSAVDEKRTFFKFNNNVKYPKIHDLFETSLCETKGGTAKLGIKPQFLLQASKAISAGPTGVIMEIADDRKAIVVRPISMLTRPYAVAIVMPIMTMDED